MKKYYITISSTNPGNRKQKAFDAEMAKYEGSLITNAPAFIIFVKNWVNHLQEQFPGGGALTFSTHENDDGILMFVKTGTNGAWYYNINLRYVRQELNF